VYTLGANCTIVCGITLGKFAFIGAGAVISKDVPDYALMVGVPGKQVGWMSEYGEKLDLPLKGNAETICKHTNQKYELKDDKVFLKRLNMKIDFANLQLQYQTYKKQIDTNIQNVLNKSNYILGEEVQTLEQELQKFTGAKYAITCSSGTDALLLALMAIDIQPGDEVITTPFTWISTGEMIALLKAKPVFVDIEPDTCNIDANLIEKAITKKTKAIMPVSLYGQPADIDKIQAIADKHNLKVIIDGAQSFGSTYNNKTDSNLGRYFNNQFFPIKATWVLWRRWCCFYK
jgi:hypothetical protein